MVGILTRKRIQEEASLAGFRLEEQAIRLLLQWLQHGGDDGQLQALFNTVDTGAGRWLPWCTTAVHGESAV